jgi:hypothetical protein
MKRTIGKQLTKEVSTFFRLCFISIKRLEVIISVLSSFSIDCLFTSGWIFSIWLGY